MYWFRDLKKRGITPSWATAYESLLSRLPHHHAAIQIDEECEDMVLDDNEGNEGDEDEPGDEDEMDSIIREDDYDDYDFDD